VLGLSLIFGLIVSVDFNQLINSIDAANLNMLLLGFLLFSIQGIFESWRFKIVFDDYGVTFAQGIRLFFIGLFFANFMPGMIGADMYQVYHMNNVRPGLLRPLSLSLFLRLTGLLGNIALGLVALYLSTISWSESIHLHLEQIAPTSRRALVLLLLALFLGVLIGSSRKARNWLRTLFEKAGNLAHELQLVATSFNALHLSLIGLLGIFVVLARAAGFYALVIAFGSSINGVDVVVVVTITTLTILLPISFAGLGIREISATAILITFGISPAVAAAIALITRFFIWALSLVGGAWFLIERRQAKICT